MSRRSSSSEYAWLVGERPALGQQFILDQMHPDGNLADVASMMKMDTREFSRRFKQSFGVTPVRFLADARIRRASGLLDGIHASTTKVAIACGFQKDAQFVFRKEAAMTPEGYRLYIAAQLRSPPSFAEDERRPRKQQVRRSKCV